MRVDESFDLSHKSISNALQNLIERKPRQREFAIATKSKLSKISNRAVRETQYPINEVKEICEFFNVEFDSLIALCQKENRNLEKEINIEIKTEGNITPADCPLEEIKEETKEKFVIIPYWEHDKHKEKVVNPCFTEFLLDVQKLINVYGRSADGLKIIAMTGDEMDGGATPIKNNDILIIDTKVNNTSSSGIYFYITNKSVFVRRIAEIEGKGLYFSVDNPLYTDVLNDTKTYKELEEVGFKVIGKVIGNESLSSRM